MHIQKSIKEKVVQIDTNILQWSRCLPHLEIPVGYFKKSSVIIKECWSSIGFEDILFLYYDILLSSCA